MRECARARARACVRACVCVIIITTLKYEKSGSDAMLSCACQNREQETAQTKQRTMPRQPARRDTARPRERPQETCLTENEAETQNTPKHTLHTQNNKGQQHRTLPNTHSTLTTTKDNKSERFKMTARETKEARRKRYPEDLCDDTVLGVLPANVRV